MPVTGSSSRCGDPVRRCAASNGTDPGHGPRRPGLRFGRGSRESGGMEMAKSGSILGNSVQRLEDPTLLTGTGKYVDDLVEPNMVHIVFVRSPVAHGTITPVDTGEAES